MTGRVIALAALMSVLASCGVKSPPVREGVAPPAVATTVIRDATTEPDRPRGTLF